VGLEVLVEVRDEGELITALQVPSAVIGVNSRDLETLHIDARQAAALMSLIPSSRVAVFESGVQSRSDVSAAALAGADAVLVGSVLSAASDPTGAVQMLAGVPKVNNARRR
jgi:indole-3-glycerol phosphate synthase